MSRHVPAETRNWLHHNAVVIRCLAGALMLLVLCLLPCEAQVTATSTFSADTLNREAPIVTMPSAAVAISVSASTLRALSRSAYPVVKIYANQSTCRPPKAYRIS